MEERMPLSGLSLTVDTRQDVVDATAAEIAVGSSPRGWDSVPASAAI